MLLCYNQILYPLGGRPTDWKTRVSQKFCHRSARSGPRVSGPGRGSGTGRRGHQRLWSAKAGAASTPALSKASPALGRRARRRLRGDPGWDCLQAAGGSLGRRGLAGAPCEDTDAGGSGSRTVHRHERSRRPGPPNSLQAPALGCPRATTRVGAQPSSGAGRLPKCLPEPTAASKHTP